MQIVLINVLGPKAAWTVSTDILHGALLYWIVLDLHENVSWGGLLEIFFFFYPISSGKSKNWFDFMTFFFFIFRVVLFWFLMSFIWFYSYIWKLKKN